MHDDHGTADDGTADHDLRGALPGEPVDRRRRPVLLHVPPRRVRPRRGVSPPVGAGRRIVPVLLISLSSGLLTVSVAVPTTQHELAVPAPVWWQDRVPPAATPPAPPTGPPAGGVGKDLSVGEPVPIGGAPPAVPAGANRTTAAGVNRTAGAARTQAVLVTPAAEMTPVASRGPARADPPGRRPGPPASAASAATSAPATTPAAAPTPAPVTGAPTSGNGQIDAPSSPPPLTDEVADDAHEDTGADTDTDRDTTIDRVTTPDSQPAQHGNQADPRTRKAHRDSEEGAGPARPQPAPTHEEPRSRRAASEHGRY
jgi:hypothetical protein